MVNRKRILRLLSYLFLIVTSCIMGYPVLFLLVGSFLNADPADGNVIGSVLQRLIH